MKEDLSRTIYFCLVAIQFTFHGINLPIFYSTNSQFRQELKDLLNEFSRSIHQVANRAGNTKTIMSTTMNTRTCTNELVNINKIKTSSHDHASLQAAVVNVSV